MELTAKIKIGISLLCLSIILFILGNIVWLSSPNAYVETYSNTNVTSDAIVEKDFHLGMIPIFISAFIGLFGLILIFFDIRTKENKGLKYFTIATLVFTVISIISIFLAFYWLFTPLEDPTLLYGSYFLFVSTITYIPYLIYFGIVYRRLKVADDIMSINVPQKT